MSHDQCFQDICMIAFDVGRDILAGVCWKASLIVHLMKLITAQTLIAVLCFRSDITCSGIHPISKRRWNTPAVP